MEADNSRKKPLALDWDEVLGRTEDEPLELVVIDTKTPKASLMISADCSSAEDFSHMNDRDLEEAIKRQGSNVINLGPKLPDNGEKLRSRLKGLEEERERRKLRRTRMDISEDEKPVESTSSDKNGAPDRQQRANIWSSSQVRQESLFASSFRRKMEEDSDCREVAFHTELSTLGHCNDQKSGSNGGLSLRETPKTRSSSRQQPFQSANSLSRSADKYGSSNVRQKGRVFNSLSKKKDPYHFLPSNGVRRNKGPPVVLVDEDEVEHLETIDQANKLAERMKDVKIYFPSRDDPQSVEICYTDIKCLDPEGFLTSPIMNYYIRYLWKHASPTKSACDYHFFNTFFYEKLKQAMSYKGSDKESSFVKFRRWWKGVNIFQQSYVLIPIHEDLHWSLVIICIPDREDESGPIVLHLDSLGLHHSKSIFENIKSFLKEEWKYLHGKVSPSDLPVSDRIWEYLPRRIEEKKINVPQQKNDYDCGPFVLYFIERFIIEAPERLKKKDLEMFGKQWFKPEEASGLRKKIRKLLLEEFQTASEGGCGSESSP